MPLEIRIDDLGGAEVADLLTTHADLMLSLSPPGSCHFLPLQGLKVPEVTFWSMWQDEALIGCGALKDLGDGTGEIKSMHARQHLRGKGHGRAMLEHILAEARARGYTALYLETGSMDGFIPARRLYEAYGFTYCEPFGSYVEDPHSVFMSLDMQAAA
ncbi:GNAT family N-acetyltransferase [Hyphomonas pacifica]|uniref:Uncharacterized protein n=1 Tax=Hyphomonas pacifica TaxID=1280941 RepID=A0A062TMY6_9PROT|nr:GNAT family N-acetyltransferase [Hyphomonas pacifica]KCZ45505.1 hypothetical protein HY2_06630 [Hyphomonas pacifica]RAN35677.1 hypothetical protein HY3_07600 [Hyphomonas pacifica]